MSKALKIIDDMKDATAGLQRTIGTLMTTINALEESHAEMLDAVREVSDRAGQLDPLAAPPARIDYDTIMRVRDVIKKAEAL